MIAAVDPVTSTASAPDRDLAPQPAAIGGVSYEAPFSAMSDQLLLIWAVVAMLAVNGAVIVAIFVMIVRDRKKDQAR